MIFVTVGTHEQPFDRLFSEIAVIKDQRPELEFFCQHGTSAPHPRLPGVPFLAADEMARRISGASTVITHGGPGSILPALAAKKPLVLVPRKRAFNEHVDDHQVAFCARVSKSHNLEMVTDIRGLGDAIRLARPPRLSAAAETDEAVARLSTLIEGQLRTQRRWAHRGPRRPTRHA